MREGLRSFLRRAAWLCVVLAALTAPAEARRFRIPIFHSGGGSYGASGQEEVIDHVRDLPDTPAYRKDGEHLDVGFLYRRTLERGQVTGEDRAGGFYVLYHGTTYIRLEPDLRSALVSQLGYDPVAGHDRMTSKATTTRYKPAPLPSREERVAAAKAAAQWDGDGSTSNIPGDPSTGTRKSGSGGLLLFMFAMGAFIVVAIRWQVKRAARVIAPLFTNRTEDPDRPAAGRDGFEARVAARLAEMQAGTPDPVAPPAPPARSFGRRAA